MDLTAPPDRQSAYPAIREALSQPAVTAVLRYREETSVQVIENQPASRSPGKACPVTMAETPGGSLIASIPQSKQQWAISGCSSRTVASGDHERYSAENASSGQLGVASNVF